MGGWGSKYTPKLKDTLTKRISLMKTPLCESDQLILTRRNRPSKTNLKVGKKFETWYVNPKIQVTTKNIQRLIVTQQNKENFEANKKNGEENIFKFDILENEDVLKKIDDVKMSTNNVKENQTETQETKRKRRLVIGSSVNKEKAPKRSFWSWFKFW